MFHEVRVNSLEITGKIEYLSKEIEAIKKVNILKMKIQYLK